MQIIIYQSQSDNFRLVPNFNFFFSFSKLRKYLDIFFFKRFLLLKLLSVDVELIKNGLIILIELLILRLYLAYLFLQFLFQIDRTHYVRLTCSPAQSLKTLFNRITQSTIQIQVMLIVTIQLTFFLLNTMKDHTVNLKEYRFVYPLR